MVSCAKRWALLAEWGTIDRERVPETITTAFIAITDEETPLRVKEKAIIRKAFRTLLKTWKDPLSAPISCGG